MSEQDEDDLVQTYMENLKKWVKDRPNILAPEYLSKVEEAFQQGIVFGLHFHYGGGGSPAQWACLDFEQFKEYVSHSRPGDAYIVWSMKELLDRIQPLAHGAYAIGSEHDFFILSSDAMATIRNYLNVQYNEIITVYVSENKRKAECDWGDIDSYDDFIEHVRAYNYPNCEVYVFSLAEIDKSEHYLVTAKYPNGKGEVPVSGAY